MPTRLTYPSWSNLVAFENALKKALENIDSARLGQPFYEIERWPSGHFRSGKTSVVQAGDYSPTVIRLIDQASSLIGTGEIGKWISVRRTAELDQLLETLHQNCGLSEIAPQQLEKLGVAQVNFDSIRKAQKRERELRFLSDFALICGRVHWQRWITANTSLSRLESFEEARQTLVKQLRPILQDRYITRRLSAQETAALNTLQKLSSGLNLSLESMSPDGVRLHPYKRFHADGRGLRMEVGTEVFLLCKHCFGHCPEQTLVSLLQISDLDLPTKFDDWLADVMQAGARLTAAFEQAQYCLLPLPSDVGFAAYLRVSGLELPICLPLSLLYTSRFAEHMPIESNDLYPLHAA